MLPHNTEPFCETIPQLSVNVELFMALKLASNIKKF